MTSYTLAERLNVNVVAAGPLTGAACASPQLSPDAMFPPQGDRRAAQFARKVCASCPVSKEVCLAQNGHLRHGVVAGLTARERRRLRVGGAGR
ncbi:WhiB family transcriptional regulator [Catenulispora sp. NF23]|uniref:WhiB family transcriptional regulator n=1 Tax=Catenulispora pinistramenti TaxID=2705254 RepID=UPI001BAA8425|nr:WhiB family transcriptional regulator [Catenulispora pinistramenti]MBS2538851.1 WhiB family transcriptional regulator [Catenulispora pinistramenti]